MLCHVRNLHTETTLSLVNDESSGLEYCRNTLILGIEITQCDKVSEKPIEVTENIEELIYHGNVRSLFCKCSILSHQLKKTSLSVLGNEILNCIKSQTFYTCTSLGSLPGYIGGEFRSDCSPVRFCKYLLILQGYRLDELELCRPGRVYRCRKIDLRLARDMGDRIRRDLVCLCCQVFCTDRLNT